MLAARLRASRKLASGALRASKRNPRGRQLRVSNVESRAGQGRGCGQGRGGSADPRALPRRPRRPCWQHATLPTPASAQTLLEAVPHKNLRDRVILGKLMVKEGAVSEYRASNHDGAFPERVSVS